MSGVNDLVLVQGMKDTRVTLRRWNDRPLHLLGPWVALSLVVAIGLLGAVWLVAELTGADATVLEINGLTRTVELDDYLRVLYRNGLVLALHAMACVAGFMAGSSIPMSAANRSGLDRWVHEKAGRFAIAFVVCATTFSLVTQAYIIGGTAATYAGQLGISPALLIVGLLPHALPELVALFLPLAAWLIASTRNRWEELLAATVVTVAIAVPTLVLAVVVELHVSPMLLEALAR
ncbi:MAG: hypothetical protein AABM31_02130 [Actinomycetota bacterium]